MTDFILIFVAIWLCALPCFVLRPFLKKFGKKLIFRSFFQMSILIVVVTIVEVIVLVPLFDRFRSDKPDADSLTFGAIFALFSAGLLLLRLERRGR